MTAQLASKMRDGGYQSNYNSHHKNKHNGHKNNKHNKFKSGGKNNGFNGGRDNQNKSNNGYNSLKNGQNSGYVGNNGHKGQNGQNGQNSQNNRNGYNSSQNNGSQNGYKFKAPESKFNWKNKSNSYTESSSSNGGLKDRKTSFFNNRSNSIDNQNIYKSKNNILNSGGDHKYQPGDKRRNSEPNFHPNKKPHTSNLTNHDSPKNKSSKNQANPSRSRNNSTSSNSEILLAKNQKPEHETDCVSGIPKPKISLSEFCPPSYSSWQQRAVNKGQISCGFHNRGNTGCFFEKKNVFLGRKRQLKPLWVKNGKFRSFFGYF